MIIDKKLFCTHLGKIIRSIRLDKGFTIENVAFKSGMEYKQVSRIEHGEINTTVFQIHRLAYSLDITTKNIFEKLDDQIQLEKTDTVENKITFNKF